MTLIIFLLGIALGELVNGQQPVFTEEALQAINCPEKGNPSNQCDGLTCYVNEPEDCRQVMRNNGCGVAFVSVMKNANQQYQCKMVYGRDPSLSADSPIYLRENVKSILFFKMYSGIASDIEPADAFLSGRESREIKFPGTKTTRFSTGSYYKSPLWNIRDRIGTTTVTVGMYGNLGDTGSDSCQLTFAHSNGGNGEWFNKDNLFSSFPFPVAQLKNNGYHFFSIKGWNEPHIGRQFYTMWHGSCPGDVGPMVVMTKQDPCPWGNTGLPLPRFLCAATWYPNMPITNMEPNMNNRVRFMKELEVTGRLLRPVHVLYAKARN